MLRIVHHAGTDGQQIPALDLNELCRLAAREMLALALEAERRALKGSISPIWGLRHR